MEKRRPVMLVGNAGTGKTVLAGDKFASLDPDEIMVANVPFNYYTTSAMLQNVLEKPLEKKAGRNYGPPGSKKLIYFIDDMNMPEVCDQLYVGGGVSVSLLSGNVQHQESLWSTSPKLVPRLDVHHSFLRLCTDCLLQPIEFNPYLFKISCGFFSGAKNLQFDAFKCFRSNAIILKFMIMCKSNNIVTQFHDSCFSHPPYYKEI